MKRIAQLVVLLVWFSPAVAIVNGVPVDSDEFNGHYPWMTAVVHTQNGGICGGVLISPTWVLTAAHCTSSQKFVLYGSTDLDEARRVEVVRSIRHPRHNKPPSQYDVGLLQLAGPLSITPLMLADESTEALLKADAPAFLLGWGRLPNRTLPDQLRQFELLNAKPLVRGTLLALTASGGPCHRDSGGPLLVADNEGRLRLVAVISATDGNLCSKGGGTAYYTRIVSVRAFIAQHVTDLPVTP